MLYVGDRMLLVCEAGNFFDSLIYHFGIEVLTSSALNVHLHGTVHFYLFYFEV
jgi:hypothetical protein